MDVDGGAEAGGGGGAGAGDLVRKEMYLVKWKNLSYLHNSWEMSAHLQVRHAGGASDFLCLPSSCLVFMFGVSRRVISWLMCYFSVWGRGASLFSGASAWLVPMQGQEGVKFEKAVGTRRLISTRARERRSALWTLTTTQNEASRGGCLLSDFR